MLRELHAVSHWQARLSLKAFSHARGPAQLSLLEHSSCWLQPGSFPWLTLLQGELTPRTPTFPGCCFCHNIFQYHLFPSEGCETSCLRSVLPFIPWGLQYIHKSRELGWEMSFAVLFWPYIPYELMIHGRRSWYIMLGLFETITFIHRVLACHLLRVCSSCFRGLSESKDWYE